MIALRLTSIILTLIPLAQTVQADITAEAVQRGKGATAIVIVPRAGRILGSAFCISASGYFVTCDHVVRGKAAGDKINMIIDPGQETQREVDATIVRFDPDSDLAVLRVEAAGELTVLPLGEATKLIETNEIVAFGYPSGRARSIDANYPSVSVSVGRITAMRMIDGKLESIQTDAAINPGNSGGPILDSKGNVVGVINAQVRDAGSVNFAVPVERVRALVAMPDVAWQAQTIAYEERHRESNFGITVRPLLNENIEYDVKVKVENSIGETRLFEAVRSEGNYSVRLVPVPLRNGPPKIPVRIQFENGIVHGLMEERAFDVAGEQFKLSEIHRMRRENDQWTAEMTLGSSRAAPPELGTARIDVGGGVVDVNLDLATSIEVDEPAADWGEISTLISVSRGGKAIGEFSTVLNIDLPPIGDNIVPGVPVKGKFYVTVDDSATVHLGGKEIRCNYLATSSDPQELALGDVVVVDLNDVGGNRHFGMVFVSMDGRFVVSFRAEDFRVIPDKKIAEINLDAVRKAKQPANEIPVAGDIQIPVPPNIKHRSQFLWGGDKGHSIIATVIHPEMLRRGN